MALAATVPLDRAMATRASTSHWAFLPPRDPIRVIKSSGSAVSAASSIDGLVGDQLDRLQIKPFGLANKAALLRRVTYDLTGLPPTPAELKAFLVDNSWGSL